MRHWQSTNAPELREVIAQLELLDLTWKLRALSISETEVELRVGRLPQPAQGGAQDLVNIADVGFGVSQSLPVLVALLAAKPGQVVYIEQPEIHLHPRAQHRMAKILADAAARGVRVIVETHSSLLLLGLQTAIGKGALEHTDAIFHWFRRDSSGFTSVESETPDDVGRSAAGRSTSTTSRSVRRQRSWTPPIESGRGAVTSKVTSRVLIIDASVARAAGGERASHPSSARWRKFLLRVLEICHRVGLSDRLRDEWKAHRSSYASTWLQSMYARRKVEDASGVSAVVPRVLALDLEAADLSAIKKDAHLVAAAEATEWVVASLDDRVRSALERAAARGAGLKQLVWVNPAQHEDAQDDWLTSGAPSDAHRTIWPPASTPRTKKPRK